MNPAHNSYTGPETQYTKFTRHRETGAQEQQRAQGCRGGYASTAGAPAQQSGPKARCQATCWTGEASG